MQDIKQSLLNYLEANNKKYVDRGDKISHSCLNPLHDDNNASAYTILSETPFSCCSSCGFSLNTEKLYSLLEVGYDEKQFFHQQIKNILKQAEPKLEKESAQIFLPIKEAMFDKSYRGISAETFEKINAYYTFKEAYYGKRIIFPIYNVNNQLILFEAVSTNKNIQPKVLRNKGVDTTNLFGFENLLGESDTIFITEGLFSALSFWELGYQAVFNFGVSSIKNKIKKLTAKGIKNIILAGDADSAGEQFNKECYQLLKHNFTVCFFQFPFNFKDKGDSNDLLKKDREVLQECIDKTLGKNMIKIKIKEVKKDDN